MIASGAKVAGIRPPAVPDRVHARIYPEYAAGGFAPDGHFVLYFNRVNALLTPESTVLDFGAGRGKFREIETGWKLELCSLKGRCARVIGTDVDPVVMANPMTDENHLIGPDGALPIPDNSIDLVTSWAVFEHVTNPERAAAELDRVLKPGGWICAWTPNRWGYVGIGARAIPNRLHVPVLRRIGVDRRKEEDVFPVAYRMNTRPRLKRLFPVDRFEHFVAIRSGPPGYHAGNIWLARLIKAYDRFAPAPCRSMMHIFLRKRA